MAPIRGHEYYSPVEAMTSAYFSGLTRDQWAFLFPLLPGPKATGRPHTVDWYAVMNAILYVLTTRCVWSRLPKEFPPYSTVYDNLRECSDFCVSL